MARPDAAAWTILALEAAGQGRDVVASGRRWLETQQLPDGRVCVDPEHREAAWPTPLAILAWHPAPEHRRAEERALTFLLEFGGVPLPRDPALGHDSTLIGWPWIERTHSWVEPTAFGLLALRINRLEDHPRAVEARDLLFDRRLPHGGWNYGNTLAFGQELRASPDSTGIALAALAGSLSPERLRRELSYLRGEIDRLRSPLSLAWGLLGLSAWGERPGQAPSWIEESLGRQRKLGPYDLALVALLLLSSVATDGLLAQLEGRPR